VPAAAGGQPQRHALALSFFSAARDVGGPVAALTFTGELGVATLAEAEQAVAEAE